MPPCALSHEKRELNQGAVRGEFIEPLACMDFMEFFLDTADVDEIREIAAWGLSLIHI